MSGHSKWHNIRLRKGVQDAKRGNLFTKLAKEIIMAAKNGGGNPDNNLRLRLAIQKARDNSMPADNIKRSVQRGTGEIEGAVFEELTYEGYGPAGVAVIVEVATDNKNRTVAVIRNLFARNGGRLGESGSVGYRFRPVGIITVAKSGVEEDTLFGIALEAGAEDVRSDDENFEIVTEPEDFGAVRQALEEAKVAFISAALTMEPTDSVMVEGKDVETLLNLIERLEDDDDVQNVYANFEMSDEAMEAAAR
jgi:YebC/PmpR family DNA-binding regulatory protein